MPWEACCTEVAKLKVRRREPAEVVVLAQAVGAEHDAVGGDADEGVDERGGEDGSQAVLATALATPGGKEMRIQEVEG